MNIAPRAAITITTTTTAAIIVKFPEPPLVVLDVVDAPGEEADDVGGALTVEVFVEVEELDAPELVPLPAG